MRVALARAMMAVAVRCLGDRHRDWAAAMVAEFEVAVAAGAPVTFALGCLLGSLRTLPAHDEGRFTLASHLLAVGVMIPLAALLFASVARGYPLLAPIDAGASAVLGGGGPDAVTVANRPGLPLLALLTGILGAGHLLMAWAVLDRAWPRVAAIGHAAAALTATLVIFTAVLFLRDPCALPQAAMVVAELAAIRLLVRWHADLPAHGCARPLDRWS